VRASVGKGDPGSDHEVFDRPGDEDLVGLREGGDLTGDLNGRAAHALPDQLDLACVNSGA